MDSPPSDGCFPTERTTRLNRNQGDNESSTINRISPRASQGNLDGLAQCR